MRCVLPLALLLAAGGASAQDRAAQHCTLEDAGAGSVRAVNGTNDLLLTDGREIRLAGIEIAESAAAALRDLVQGGELTLKRIPNDTDRHGRLPAFAYRAGVSQSVQHELLAAGHARVAARVGDRRCAADLLVAEAIARNAALGLWTQPAYRPRSAVDPASVLSDRGRLTLVEGRILSVRESGGTIYVNFGRRWSEDFTATLLRRNERSFAAAGLNLKSLSGRQVRVRGVVEERGGPWIELNRPEQIEILD
jgi:endonuclease YncB( thermonuclease family)